jgi:RNA polymerase sigma factor (sigma-70 family)
VIDPREKERLFEEVIAGNDRWLGVVARNNAPIDSWQDLEQEIRIAFWQSLDSYGGEISDLGKWFFSVARNTAKEFRRQNHRTRKRDEGVYPNPVFVEQDRDELRIVEEFTGTLGELDRQVFTMYIDDLSYAEMSAALGVDEANLRKRMSRIKEQFKAKYQGL